MMPSIKRFLLIYITLAMLLIYGCIIFASYWVSKNELDELYDANLQQVASAIAAQHLAMHDISQRYNLKNGKNLTTNHAQIDGEEAFYVRVLAKDGALLYESHPQAAVPMPLVLGFSTQQQRNKYWRIYAIKADQATIHVAQSLKLRKMTIKETALSLMTSQLLFMPILVILIFMAIRKALAPLSTLSTDILQRKSLDLKPFSEATIPLEIKPLVHALNAFMQKVSDMVGVLKRFTADAAHELRTPITALRIQLTLLEQATTNLERDAAMLSLKNGIDRSEQLVRQLLALARIEPNALPREMAAFNLLSLVKECIADLFPLAHEKAIDLGLNTLDEINIVGVRHEIKTLLTNIIDNAIRYTPPHGKVDIALLSLNIALPNKLQHTILEVNDTGPGISTDNAARVFERFFRGENKSVSGAGLGLSIVKEIATQHGANITLRNLHPGLSFKVYFPPAKPN